MTTAIITAAQGDYAADLRRELAVLPRRSARDILDGIEEHMALDEGHFAVESLGAPSAIARSALDEQTMRRGRAIRPSLSLPSKSLQLAVAVIAAPFTVFALLAFTNAGSIGFLISAAIWVLIAVPPLLVRWPAWWAASIVCVFVHVAYSVGALVVTMAGPSVTAAGTAFLVTGPVAVAHFAGIVLALVALLRAPRVLRTGRR
ncbi:MULTISPECIES: hypothetical protein [Clavibacter]|uniref:DUF1700 domain-containing protein n=2 Tax=Clavibacter TaxID=1573 RepID=A0A399P253_9MICO|nr:MULTISPECIES: hypothetical protein [Clavibacter]KDP91517.1 hypothetical protein W824_06150 [Clavibacter cf. michiganensis LMG 26808]RII98886.1 hypothetical protein DZF96_01140 [Clavibacter michiganensis]UKF25910.1 hypothetical protein KYT88_04200 [Clavibacter sp. A6099]